MALALGLLFSPTAWAQTAAGTNVTNTASVDFTVGGINQADVTSNTDDFEVDQLIDLTVAEDAGTFTAVVPDQTTFDATSGTIRFSITNTGNATQDIAVVASNQADATVDPFGGNADSWDTQGAFSYYLDDGDDVFEPGAGDTALPVSGVAYLDEVPAGAVRIVWVEPADIPANDPGNTLDGDPDQDMDNGNNAVVALVATVRTGGAAAALGAVLVNDLAADDKLVVDIVFGDADGPYDGALDAAESDDSAFRVSNAAITISKDSTVESDPINLAVNPKRIPGATVRYTIVVNNAAGAATATGVVVTDLRPANTTYVAASVTLNTVADPDADAGADDCDFGATTANTLTCDFTTVPANTTHTITYDVTIN
jgi:uncharacterized repeat protein (TIGR01451 family)